MMSPMAFAQLQAGRPAAHGWEWDPQHAVVSPQLHWPKADQANRERVSGCLAGRDAEPGQIQKHFLG